MKASLLAALSAAFLLAGCQTWHTDDYCSAAVKTYRLFLAYDLVAEVSETDFIRANNAYDLARKECAKRGITLPAR
jgi:hypothetical protein